jgi:RHS repeat-associated protein
LGRLRIRREYQGAPSSLASETRYVYDSNRVIQERDTNSTPQVAYTRGTDMSGTLEGAGGIGGLLSRSVGYSAGNWSTHHFYHADGNGNITYMVDGSQAMAASYRYDPFGNTTSISGTWSGANVYRFSSKEAHVSSGMNHYGYRFYDSSLQRWINRDPLSSQTPQTGRRWGKTRQIEVEQGPNLYWPFRNDPVSNRDPDGRLALPIVVCVIIAGAVICSTSCTKAPPKPPPAPPPCDPPCPPISNVPPGNQRDNPGWQANCKCWCDCLCNQLAVGNRQKCAERCYDGCDDGKLPNPFPGVIIPPSM